MFGINLSNPLWNNAKKSSANGSATVTNLKLQRESSWNTMLTFSTIVLAEPAATSLTFTTLTAAPSATNVGSFSQY
jgi:hypothetical protein